MNKRVNLKREMEKINKNNNNKNRIIKKIMDKTQKNLCSPTFKTAKLMKNYFTDFILFPYFCFRILGAEGSRRRTHRSRSEKSKNDRSVSTVRAECCVDVFRFVLCCREGCCVVCGICIRRECTEAI